MEGAHQKRIAVAIACAALALFGPITFASDAAIIDRIGTGHLQDGDVILRHAHGRWSRWFRDASPMERRFSHVGIIAHDPRGPIVIHADASDATGIGRVRAEPLAAFLAKADDWAVFRVFAPPDERARIAAEARAMIGLPFDARFDLEDASRVYCTELVFRAFERALGAAGNIIAATERNGKPVIFLDACYLGPQFAKVADAGRQTSAGISQF